jgi:hypothetical protein
MRGDCELPDMYSAVFGGSGATQQQAMKGDCEFADPSRQVIGIFAPKKATYPPKTTDEISRNSHSPLIACTFFRVFVSKKVHYPPKTSDEISHNSHSPFIACTFFAQKCCFC